MAHLDEGTLHALLDGALQAMEPARADAVEAHLATCAECRARLDAAASLRDRAADVLGVLEPTVLPDFEEVLVRSGRPAGLRRQLRWTRGLAWAAMFVVALGTGYLIRDQLIPERAAFPTAPLQRAEGSSGAAAARVESTAGSPRVAARADVAPPDEVPPAEALPVTASADASGTGDPAAREQDARRELERQRELELQRTLDLAVRRQAAREAAANERAANERPASALMAPAAAAPMSVAAAVTPEAAFDTVAAEDVLELVGAPLLVLPEAEVVLALVGGESTGPVIVSLQRLDDGAEIRVTQRPVRIALDAIVVTGMVAAQNEPDSVGDSTTVERAESAAAPAEAAEEAAADAAVGVAAGTSADAPPAGSAAPLGVPVARSAIHSVSIGAPWIGWGLVLEGPLPEDALRALGAAARPYEWPGS